MDRNTVQIQTKLRGVLDDLPHQTQLFVAACHTVQTKNQIKQDAEKYRNEIAKHHPINQDALDKAQAALQAAITALHQAQDKALQTSLVLLDQAYSVFHNNDDHNFQHLVWSTIVLVHGTPSGLARYCQDPANFPHRADALVDLLKSNDDKQQQNRLLLRDMVLSGGARKGQYGPALEIYTQLMSHIDCGYGQYDNNNTKITSRKKDDDNQLLLLQRLALAVALELSDPLPEFHQDTIHVDPIQRYLHYEQAYLMGELDPIFATKLSVWELRMVINSDAPNDQIGWGREMLRNYRPDMMLLEDRWRYCRIVRTDVYYTGQPNWDPTKPLDYPQILSGTCTGTCIIVSFFYSISFVSWGGPSNQICCC